MAYWVNNLGNGTLRKPTTNGQEVQTVTLKAVLVSIHTQQGSESALFLTNCHLKPFWSHATFLHRYTHTRLTYSGSLPERSDTIKQVQGVTVLNLEQMTFYGCCNHADGMRMLQSTLHKLSRPKTWQMHRRSGCFQTAIFVTSTSKLGLSVYLQIQILNSRNTNQDESTLIYDYNKTDPISAGCLTVHQTRCISHPEKLQQ